MGASAHLPPYQSVFPYMAIVLVFEPVKPSNNPLELQDMNNDIINIG